ncbi:ATP-binding protein [Streptomyces sp. XD-27]|uniref:ATP-binding protein n=1 Tax=Streptomyces sp. XD-27 TaxID=3062779 RepID=UPI0026F46628|nr:ATP-binding protein [Streptomyces sp. XD-27]WKX70199.1 ATP-binding protein [Streptomyces sp. XD-27]
MERPQEPIPVRYLDRLNYTPYPGSVPIARKRTARLVGEWGHKELAGDAALVLAELLTNALLHGSLKGQLIPVQLTLTARALRIGVADPRGDRVPSIRIAADGDQFGRGLLIVDSLAARWGVRPCTGGKEVWAEFDL